MRWVCESNFFVSFTRIKIIQSVRKYYLSCLSYFTYLKPTNGKDYKSSHLSSHYKGSTIWKWPHRHPRSFQVSRTRISLALRFQETPRGIFLSARSACCFWITRANVIFPTDEGLSTSRNVLKEHQKTSQCQTIILQPLIICPAAFPGLAFPNLSVHKGGIVCIVVTVILSS